MIIKGKIRPLYEDEINQTLAKLPGWIFRDDKLEKTIQFASFTAGIAFISELAPYCEEINHHPDINIRYRSVTFYLRTHDAGDKVTERDLVLASKIEELLQQTKV